MTENSNAKPFEERAKGFKMLIQAIGIGVGGQAERDIRDLGSLIVEYQALETEEARDKFKEEKISPMYDKLGEAEKSNPKVGEVVVKIVMSENIFF